jgi:hypothetical protein
MRSLADVHKLLMLYPGVERHGTSVQLDRQGQQRDRHAVFQQSAACWGGSGLAWLGLLIVYNVYPVCMQLLACSGHLVHLQVQVCRVTTPVSVLKLDGHHPS